MIGSVAGQQAAFVPPKITPAERPLSGLGLLRAMIRDPVAAVSRAAYEEPFTRIRAGGRDLFTLTDPPGTSVARPLSAVVRPKANLAVEIHLRAGKSAGQP